MRVRTCLEIGQRVCLGDSSLCLTLSDFCFGELHIVLGSGHTDHELVWVLSRRSGFPSLFSCGGLVPSILCGGGRSHACASVRVSVHIDVVECGALICLGAGFEIQKIGTESVSIGPSKEHVRAHA